MPTPDDYLERVYAGVLGKLIGVYVGRPFEGWTHQKIVEKLGAVHHYVHEQLDAPLVVADDDVSGTFVFVNALREHGVSPDLTSEAIGQTWLNNVIEDRTIFWWGGNGISTEHTAYHNLKKGIPAPRSGAIATNGKTVAEQIGAQIFIDGWALVAPGNPALAARLADAAGKVSHDGESVYAAVLWAAMEAEAFVSKDVDHLLDTGLSFIPADSLIATVIGKVRRWVKEDGDWEATRQRIEDQYGYDKFCGVCHVVPNHAIMVMALLYAGHDFHEALHIINTSGWDTDCNSGNVGCLVALINGLDSLDDGGPDWRGPLADRALISSADAGYSINNAARITYDLVDLGRQLAGEPPLTPPKDGAQFHFALPGSVQGFQATPNTLAPDTVTVEQALDNGKPGLAIHLKRHIGTGGTDRAAEVLTDTYQPPDVITVPIYNFVSSPLVYPGQTVTAAVRADAGLSAPVQVQLRLKAYTPEDTLTTVDGPPVTLSPGSDPVTLKWTIPDSLANQPIESVGLALGSPATAKGRDRRLDGTVWLDYLRYDGVPRMTLKKEGQKFRGGPSYDYWYRAFVNSADKFYKRWGSSFRVAQDRGEGLVSQGTREWRDYQTTVAKLTVTIGGPVGVAVRVQGINRYYALVFTKAQDGGKRKVAIVKALDDKRIELASSDFAWELDEPYEVTVAVQGDTIVGKVGDKAEVTATDGQYEGGGAGLVVFEGSLAADSISIGPVEEK